MSAEALKENLRQIKEIVREISVFTGQLDNIKTLELGKEVQTDTKEKKLLNESITSLTNQLKILNNSIPELIQRIGFYPKLETDAEKPAVGKPAVSPEKAKEKLIQVKYKPKVDKEKVSLVIGDKDRKNFLENLSKSNLSVNQLKKKYAVEKPEEKIDSFGKPNAYAKISNRFFRNLSNRLIVKGYLDKLNQDLRKISSPFILGTYTSMIFFTVFISLIISFFLFILLLFVKVSFSPPFISFAGESLLLRFFKVVWIILIIPSITGLMMYSYPSSEGKNLGKKIDQELPFVAIHMSAIATSGIETLNIFKIILKNKEYKYTNREFKKLMNLINFHGEDFVNALKKTAKSSSSTKLSELLDGLATATTSGGDLNSFLNKHAESLLFDYKLEREKYTKVSETFMDIYISIVIAAPMILLMLFTIMGSTGALSGFLGLSTELLGFLIIGVIVVLNLGFLIFLKLKQPTF